MLHMCEEVCYYVDNCILPSLAQTSQHANTSSNHPNNNNNNNNRSCYNNTDRRNLCPFNEPTQDLSPMELKAFCWKM